MGKPRGALIVALTAIVLVSAACDSDSPESHAQPSKIHEPDIPFANVWSADEGIELAGRGAELIRASSEAGEYSYFYGSAHGYPGYEEATSGSGRDGVDDVFTRENPTKGDQSSRTLFRHITDFAATDASVKATVCDFTIYPNPGRLDAPPHSSQFALQEAVAIELANSGAAPGTPGTADAKPDSVDPRAHRPPTWNVFGSWRIEKLRVIEPSQLPDGCARWWRQKFPDSYQDPGSNIVRVPADVQIPTQPVAVQYPEWIGPTKPG